MRAARSFAALAAAGAVGATILARLGWDAAAQIAYPATLLFVALEFARLGRLPRTLLALMGLSCLYATMTGTVADLDFGPALFAFAFILATGLLREIASRDPAFRALAEGLVGLRGPRRFPVVSMAVAVAGLSLLIGALQFLAGLVSRMETPADTAARNDVIRAGLAGYLLIPLLSPLAIPTIVVTSVVPAHAWDRTLPILLAVAAVTWLAAYAQDRLTGVVATAGGPSIAPVPLGQAMGAAARAVAPLALAAALHWLAGLALATAAILAIAVAAVAWSLLLQKTDLVSEGLSNARNEAVIIGASIATGLAVAGSLPILDNLAILASGPGVLLAPMLFLAFVLGGVIGVQPALCFMIATPVLAAVATADPAYLDQVLAAAIAGWAINSVTSPFGLPILIAASATGDPPGVFLLKRNVLFTFAAPCLATGVLAVSAL